MDLSVDLRRFGGAGGLDREISAPFDAEAIQLDLTNPTKIEVLSTEIDMKDARCGIVSGAPGHNRLCMDEVNVGKRRLAVRDAQVCIELGNRFSVSRCVVGVNLALGLGFRSGAADLQENICHPGNWIVVARKDRGCGDVHTWQVDPCGRRALGGELSVL